MLKGKKFDAFTLVGQGDEDERRAAIGAYANAERCGENHQTGKNGYDGVDDSYVNSRLQEIGFAREVAGKRANAAHAKS